MDAPTAIELPQALQPRYRAHSVGDWTVIPDVVAFGELAAWERGNPEAVGASWHRRAVEDARACEMDHLPPLHTCHHNMHDADQIVKIGYARPKAQKQGRYDGKTGSVMTLDLYLFPEFARTIKGHHYNYISVEVDKNWDQPRINSVSLLDHDDPYFRLPMLTIEDGNFSRSGESVAVLFHQPGGLQMPDEIESPKGDSDNPETGESGDDSPETFGMDDMPPWAEALVSMLIERMDERDSMNAEMDDDIGFEEEGEEDFDDFGDDEFADDEEVDISDEDDEEFAEDDSDEMVEEEEEEPAFSRASSRKSAREIELERRVEAMERENRERRSREAFARDVEAAKERVTDALGGITDQQIEALEEARKHGVKALESAVAMLEVSSQSFGRRAPSRVGSGTNVPKPLEAFARKGPQAIKEARPVYQAWLDAKAAGQTKLDFPQYAKAQGLNMEEVA